MKIKAASAGLKIIDEEYLVERKRKFSSGQQSFERQFNSAGQEQYEQNMAELAKRIEEQGARLTKKKDICEMQRYRVLVSELLNEVVSHAYEFRKENIFDTKGRRKVYATIIKINEKLEEMAKNILSGNKDTIKVISNIDDIRGLIFDMLL